MGRHEAIGNCELMAAKRPTPGDVLGAVGAVQVGIAPHHVRALARHAMKDIAVDAACAAPGSRTLEPGDELALALPFEQVLDGLSERERGGVGSPQGVVVDEIPVQSPAHLRVMIQIAPTGVAQLRGVALAELVQGGRATDPSSAGVRGQTVGPVGLKARQVQEAQRPAVVHQHPIGVRLQRPAMQVPQVDVATRIVEHGCGEAGGGKLEEAGQPGTILRAIAAVAGIQRSERPLDMLTPPGQKGFSLRGAVDSHDGLLGTPDSIHLRA